MTRALLLALALSSAACVAVGAGLVYIPAGLIVVGLEGLALTWMAATLLVRSAGGRRE